MGSPINTKEKHGNITKPQISNCSYTLWWFSWHTSLNLRTCPWACCRFVLQGCLHSPELCRSNAFFCGCFTTIDCFPCIIIKAYHGISYQILHGQFCILPPCSFYVVVSVCSLGSFRTKKKTAVRLDKNCEEYPLTWWWECCLGPRKKAEDWQSFNHHPEMDRK